VTATNRQLTLSPTGTVTFMFMDIVGSTRPPKQHAAHGPKAVGTGFYNAVDPFVHLAKEAGETWSPCISSPCEGSGSGADKARSPQLNTSEQGGYMSGQV
jgi:hypothetical protein